MPIRRARLSLLFALLGACGERAQAPLPPITFPRPVVTWVRGDDPRLRLEGRWVPSPGGPRCAWPASAVHLRFRGRTLDVRLRDTLTDDLVRDHDAVGVVVDGVLVKRITLREGSAEYRAAMRLPDREHTVSLVKLTEAEAGTVTLEGVATDGPLRDPPPAHPRRLLVIGDSIMAGYGVDGPAGCHYDATFANAARSCASLAARALGAELHLVAWSGRGVVLNNNLLARETLPELMGRAIPTDPDSVFEPRSYVPDVVVVNLGTNDLTRPEHDPATFAAAYRRMLDRLRADYPRARIVVGLGPLITDDDPTPGTGRLRAMRELLQGIVDERIRGGDADVRLLEMPSGDPAAEGCGCDQHPSAVTHARLAGVMERALGDAW